MQVRRSVAEPRARSLAERGHRRAGERTRPRRLSRRRRKGTTKKPTFHPRLLMNKKKKKKRRKRGLEEGEGVRAALRGRRSSTIPTRERMNAGAEDRTRWRSTQATSPPRAAHGHGRATAHRSTNGAGDAPQRVTFDVHLASLRHCITSFGCTSIPTREK